MPRTRELHDVQAFFAGLAADRDRHDGRGEAEAAAPSS
jgi:hypothetical protein